MRLFAYTWLFASRAWANPMIQRDIKTLGYPLIPMPFNQPLTQSRLVSHDLYNNLATYAGFTQLSSGSCSTLPNGATLITAFDIPATDTQAVLWKFPAKKQLVVSFPGTASGQDWLTDLVFFPVPYISANIDCPLCSVHVGFLAAWNSISASLMEELRKALEGNEGYTTIITGHSLGGAIAQLAFASLKEEEWRVEAAYTYGQPRVGNLLFSHYIDSISKASDADPGNFYRVTHANGKLFTVKDREKGPDDLIDGVPSLPPALLGFVHSRTEYWESAESPAANSTFRCDGKENIGCNAGQFSLGINGAHLSYGGFDLQCVPT